jgi:2-iminobutanoate/2-iminopropanoate deaminase
MAAVNMLRFTVMATTVLVLVACGEETATTPSPDGRELIGIGSMYADASRFGDLVWTAGHLGSGPAHETPTSFEEEVEWALDRLEESLEAAGAGFDTLIKVNVYLEDWNDWATYNRLYVQRIGPHGLPPRATVQVAHPYSSFRIEIEAVAHTRPPRLELRPLDPLLSNGTRTSNTSPAGDGPFDSQPRPHAKRPHIHSPR